MNKVENSSYPSGSEGRDFPKVLIIGATPLRATSATGITMINLFSDWPRTHIAQIYDDELEPDPAFCFNYRKISHSHHVIGTKVKRFMRYMASNLRGRSDRKNASTMVAPQPTRSAAYSRDIFSASRDFVPVILSRDTIKWIKDFNPDVIYSVLGSVRVMNVVLGISKKFSLPVVPHFMDDWPEVIHSDGFAYRLRRKKMLATLRQVTARSTINLTISRDMAITYEQRYNGNYTPFMNCVDFPDSRYDNIERTKSSVDFCYIGGLHLNRWRSILDVLQAMQDVKDSGAGITMSIFAPEKDINSYSEYFRHYSVLKVLESIDADQVNNRLRTFDVLVHVESFYEEDAKYTKLSISTKIPQYMAAGKAILGYGPGVLSSFRYLLATQSGLVVTTQGDRISLTERIYRLINSDDLRRELGEHGATTALREHNAIHVREKFRSKLLAAVTISKKAIGSK